MEKKIKYSYKSCNLNNLFLERDRISESFSTGVESNSNYFFVKKHHFFVVDVNNLQRHQQIDGLQTSRKFGKESLYLLTLFSLGNSDFKLPLIRIKM